MIGYTFLIGILYVLGLGISIYMLMLIANFLKAATDACKVYADTNRRR